VAVSNVELIVNAAKAINPLKKVEQQTRSVQKRFDGLKVSVGRLQSAFAGVGFALIGKQAISAAASFNDLQTRLKLLTSQYGEYEQAQKAAANAAKTFGLSTREATEGIADIFARLRPLGVSLNDIESTFVGFNTVAKLSGTSTTEAASAFRQLAQALGSGRLQGDEFRSISEQVPGILAAISKETGVAQGNLRKYATEGKITADIVIRALKRIESEGAGSIAKIVKESDVQKFKNFQNAVDSLQVAIGQGLLPVVTPLINKATDLIKAFSALPKPVQNGIIAVTGLTAAIIILNPLIVTASGLLSAMAGPAVLGAAITGLSVVGEKALAAAAGKQVLAASVTAANTKITAMTVAVGALNLALKAIPFAIVLGGLAAFIGQLQETKRVQREVNELIQDGTVDQINAALATNQRTLAEIEFQRTVLQATPGALGGFAAGAFDVLDKALGRTKALKESILILKGQLAEGSIGGGSLPLGQPPKPPKLPTEDDPTKDNSTKNKANQAEQERLAFLQQINAEINRINQAELDGLEAGRQIVESIDRQGATDIARGEANLALLQAKLDGRYEEEVLAQRIKAIEESNLNDVQKNKLIAIENQTAALKEQAQEQEKLKEVAAQVGSTIQSGIVGAITGAIDGSKSLRESLSGILKQVGGILLNFGIGSIGSSLGIPGFRANGGPVASGRPYIVGEQGPELFMPQQSGNIRSNEDMRQLMGRSPAEPRASAMNFTFETTNIGGQEFVSREQLESAMATTRRQAANDGAKRGMNMTLDRMQNSPRTRSRVGIG
jgi:tape measure domain-containing protein